MLTLLRRQQPWLVATLLGLLAVLNAVEAPRIQRDIVERKEDRWVTFHTGGPADLGDLRDVLASPPINDRRNVYLDLYRHAPNARVYVPRNSPLQDAQLYGLGGAELVRRYDGESLDLHLPPIDEALVVAEDQGHPDRGIGPYRMVIVDGPVRDIIVITNNEGHLLLDGRLLVTGAPLP